MRLSNKSAFTLAEVLITLGIIGVVAAMTMPTLMNSTQGAQYKAAYKKGLSALSQAVTLNVALDDYNFAQATTGDAAGDASMYNIFKNRMNVVKTIEGTTGYGISADTASGVAPAKINSGSNYVLFFNDGIVFSFPQSAENCTNDATVGNVNLTNCKGFIDVNGEKNPNRVVKCDNGGTTDNDCKVKNPTDVYPVVFYDQTVLPGTPAARNVLYGDGK